MTEVEKIEIKPQIDSKVESEETEEWHWIPKVVREVRDINDDTVEVCPSLKWLNREKKLKCKKIKRLKKRL